MPHLQEYYPPHLPHDPHTLEELIRWAHDLSTILSENFFALKDLLMPHSGRARCVSELVGDAFTLDVDGLIILVSSSTGAAVTSSVTTAIKDGQLGDWLIIVNIGTFTVTFKDNANLNIGADRVLAQTDTLMLAWNGTDWVRLSQAIGN